LWLRNADKKETLETEFNSMSGDVNTFNAADILIAVQESAGV
jgi:hypothetical protein